MRIVVDTNVVASAVFFGGSPQRLLQGAISKDLLSLEKVANVEIVTVTDFLSRLDAEALK